MNEAVRVDPRAGRADDSAPAVTTEPAPAAASSSSPPPDASQLEALCAACGYDLRGLPGERTRCPECGTTIDRSAPSVLPWGQRGHVGRVLAYLRTARLAIFGTRRLATEVGRPVSFRDAQAFRWVTVILAWLPLGTAAVVLEVLAVHTMGSLGYAAVAVPNAPIPAIQIDALFALAAAAVLYVPIPLCALLFLIFASGVASYWFQPESLHVVRQNRAVALSYYACAPLALLFIPVALFAGAAGVEAAGWTDDRGGWRMFLSFLLGGGSSLLVISSMWWFVTIRLMRRATASSTGRIWLAGLLLPATWFAIGVLTLVVLPCLIGFVALMIRGLRG
jgi:hypothetical protein